MVVVVPSPVEAEDVAPQATNLAVEAPRLAVHVETLHGVVAYEGRWSRQRQREEEVKEGEREGGRVIGRSQRNEEKKR